MGVFDAAQSVVASASGLIIGDTSINISSVMVGIEDRLMEMELGPLFGLWFQSLFVGITMWALTICIFIITFGRMIEIYLVTSVAPIPMATMMGKEWGGMGQNYIRSLLALGFQAFLIIVCVAIYAVLVQNIALVDDIIGTVTTNGGNLNVRTGAGLDNTAFTQLPNGTVVDVIGRDGDWVKILLPARVGYVYGSYLTVTDAADSTVSIGGITLPFDEKELADLWQLLVGSMTGGSDALTPDGNLTLIDDIGSSTKAGKQFITLESKNGNVFYMIIDRDDEGEETVHFLNQVDEADLMALTGEEETPATCSCTTKCVAGTVNTSCPVCAVNMTECVGKEAKPEVPTEPTESAAEEPEKKSGVGGILVVLLIVALGGGAAFYIFKQKKAKPQTKGSADLDDYDYGEDE